MRTAGTAMRQLVRVMVLFLIAAAALAPGPVCAEEQWQFSATPYLWLPNVNGTLKYQVPPGAGASPEIETGPNDYLENLQTLVMVSADARRSTWSVFTDVIYLAFADQDSTVKAADFGGGHIGATLNVATSSSFRGTAWTLGGAYSGGDGRIELLGGLRYFELSATASWQLAADVIGPGGIQTFPRSGSISESLSLWDGIVGIRGRIPLGANWSAPYYVDAGTGSSRITLQGMAGIEYSFGRVSAILAYRGLYYDQKDNKLLQELSFKGPAAGVRFRF